MPQVSVLVTVYNTPASWLRECIESVLAQDVDLEIVLVDDGSTVQSTLDAMTELFNENKHIVFSRFWENRGVGAARQAALRLASAEYVALIGADDLMTTGRLAQQLMALGKHDVISGGMEYIAPDGTRLSIWTPNWKPRKPLALQGWVIADPTVLARKASIEAAGGYLPLRRAIDYELWQRLEAHGASFLVTTSIWAHYRVHPDSLSFVRSDWQKALYGRWRKARQTSATGT